MLRPAPLGRNKSHSKGSKLMLRFSRTSLLGARFLDPDARTQIGTSVNVFVPGGRSSVQQFYTLDQENMWIHQSKPLAAAASLSSSRQQRHLQDVHGTIEQ